jgi:hypothetical protein
VPSLAKRHVTSVQQVHSKGALLCLSPRSQVKPTNGLDTTTQNHCSMHILRLIPWETTATTWCMPRLSRHRREWKQHVPVCCVDPGGWTCRVDSFRICMPRGHGCPVLHRPRVQGPHSLLPGWVGGQHAHLLRALLPDKCLGPVRKSGHVRGRAVSGLGSSTVPVRVRVRVPSCDADFDPFPPALGARYCADGLANPCPPGRFSDVDGAAINSSCLGACSRGYFCGPGSKSPTQAPCSTSASHYCPQVSVSEPWGILPLLRASHMGTWCCAAFTVIPGVVSTRGRCPRLVHTACPVRQREPPNDQQPV